MQHEKQQKDRYEIIDVDGRILIRDNLESKTVTPACGLDALGYHEFLKNSQKHGNDEAQKFLGEIMVGGLPITEMRQKNWSLTIGTARRIPSRKTQQHNHITQQHNQIEA